MNTILQDLNARRVMLGKSWNDLSEICQKEPSTVKKQLDPSSNPTLATLVQIARALNAEIRMVTPESIEASVNSDVQSYRDRLNELQDEIETMRALVEHQESVIATQTERLARRDQTVAELRGIISRKETLIETMYTSIEEKDKRIADFIDRFLK